MAIDRAATLRNAEKLLRQGKVDAAIAEYVRMVEDNPRDWNTANALGDLYVRAGRTEPAIEQFLRIADSLRDQGFLPKAAALYKKVLKLKPDAEQALLQAGEIAAQQGFYADARAHLGAVLDRRSARGDSRGAAEVRVRIGSLDAADFAARIAAANARLEMDDRGGAARDLEQIAAELVEKERWADAVDVLRRASELAPDQASCRDRIGELSLKLAEAHLRGGRIDDAIALAQGLLGEATAYRDRIAALAYDLAASASEPAFALLGVVVDAAVAGGEWDAAAAFLQEFAARVPGHVQALMRLVEVSVDGSLDETLDRAQGQLADAHLAGGNATEARFIAEDLFTRHPSEPVNVERFRRTLQLLDEPDPDAIIADRLEALLPLASTDLNAGDFGPRGPAAPDQRDDDSIDEETVGCQPRRERPGTEPTPSADSRSRVDASQDPPALVQHRAAENATGASQPPARPIEPTAAPGPAEPARAHGNAVGDPNPPPKRLPNDPVDVFELSANAVDIAGILGELDEPPRAKTPAPAESIEVDLSVVLDDIKKPPPVAPLMPPSGPAGATTAPDGLRADDIEGVFAQLRDEASRRSAIEAAEQEFRRGLVLKAAGDLDGCIAALELASRAPKLRFATASLLARIFRDRGLIAEAVHWYERAAQAPAPTPDEYHVLLFELADALEAEGETIRALAICLELQAEAGDYRDVADRVDRLSKVQARG